MASKFPAYCPTCLDRALADDETPCGSCGHPSFWPHTHPNMYRKDPAAAVEEVHAVKPVEARTTVITDDDFPPSGAGAYTVPPDTGVAPAREAIVVVDEATQPEPTPPSEELEADYYFCHECGKKHRFTSSIGIEHLEYLD